MTTEPDHRCPIPWISSLKALSLNTSKIEVTINRRYRTNVYNRTQVCAAASLRVLRGLLNVVTEFAYATRSMASAADGRS